MPLIQLTNISVAKLFGDFNSKLIRLSLFLDRFYRLHGIVNDAFINLHELLFLILIDGFDVFKGFKEGDIFKGLKLERF